VILVDPLDMADPAQRLQAANMEADDGFWVFPLSLIAVLDAGEMPLGRWTPPSSWALIAMLR
jgi:hypothetical protein